MMADYSPWGQTSNPLALLRLMQNVRQSYGSIPNALAELRGGNALSIGTLPQYQIPGMQMAPPSLPPYQIPGTSNAPPSPMPAFDPQARRPAPSMPRQSQPQGGGYQAPPDLPPSVAISSAPSASQAAPTRNDVEEWRRLMDALQFARQGQ